MTEQPHLSAETIAHLAEGHVPSAAAEEHLARCPDCLAAYLDAVRVRARGLVEPAPPAPAELVAVALAVPDRSRRRRAAWLAAAAALVAVAGVWVTFVVRHPTPRSDSLADVVRVALEDASARGFVIPGAEAGAAGAPEVMRSGRPAAASAIDEAATTARERYEAGDRTAAAAYAACASLLAAGQLDAARGIAEERLRDHPRDASMRMLLAALAHRESDLDGCERHLREVLRQRPGDATARFDLGWVLAERGARAEAEREWEQLLAGQLHGPIVERTRRELERLRSVGG